jgi:hypothetical protein
MQFDGKNILCIDRDGSTRLESHPSIPAGMFAIFADDLSVELKLRLPHPSDENAKYLLSLNAAYGEVIKYEAVSDEPEVSGVHQIKSDCVDRINRRLSALRARRAVLPDGHFDIQWINERIIELKELAAELLGKQNAA